MLAPPMASCTADLLCLLQHLADVALTSLEADTTQSLSQIVFAVTILAPTVCIILCGPNAMPVPVYT